MKLKKMTMALSIIIGFSALNTNAIEIPDDALMTNNVPSEYTVVKGDTLWDISAKYFKNPLLWWKIWENNKEIKNPHLIYPDDIIYFEKGKNGKTELKIKRTSEPTVMVITPTKKFKKVVAPISTINYEKLEKFIKKTKIMDKKSYLANPYIISSENDSLIIEKNEYIYVRDSINKTNDKNYSYNIYHLGSPIIKDNKYLGNEIIKTGEAKLIAVDKTNKINKYKIKEIFGQITEKDRLIKEPKVNYSEIKLNYPENQNLTGSILSIIGGVSNAGTYDSLILDIGKDDLLKIGDILALNKKGREIIDPETKESILLPSKEYGYAVVIDVHENTSIAIILSSKEKVNNNDILQSPK